MSNAHLASFEAEQDHEMDPGSQQAESVSSTSSTSSDRSASPEPELKPTETPTETPNTSPALASEPFASKDTQDDPTKTTFSPPPPEIDEEELSTDPKSPQKVDETEKTDSHHPEDSDDDGSNSAFGSDRSSTIAYEQEPFETYQHKVAQLCRDIGYGQPLKIERMKGGGYNRIIGLTLSAGQKRDYILRIPRTVMPEKIKDNLKDQIAVTCYLSRYEFIHAPAISAFDTTTSNVLECQYVLQERIEGTALHEIFYTLPLADKLQITTAVAKMLLQLESITLGRPGRLAGVGELPDRSDVAPTSSNKIRIAGFRNSPVKDLPAMEKQSLVSLITSLLEIRKQKNLEWDDMVERCERLQAIAKEMEAVGLVRTTDNECVLWHWDFSASNLMISRIETIILEPGTGITKDCKNSSDSNISAGKWAVSAVLDWDEALSVPLVLARKPPSWLWLNEDHRGRSFSGNRDEKAGRDLTEDELLIKAHFDQIMARSSPSYVEDTYYRGPWLRALAIFAIYNFEDGYYWDKYDLFVKQWEEYYDTIEK